MSGMHVVSPPMRAWPSPGSVTRTAERNSWESDAHRSGVAGSLVVLTIRIGGAPFAVGSRAGRAGARVVAHGASEPAFSAPIRGAAFAARAWTLKKADTRSAALFATAGPSRHWIA